MYRDPNDPNHRSSELNRSLGGQDDDSIDEFLSKDKANKVSALGAAKSGR